MAKPKKPPKRKPKQPIPRRDGEAAVPAFHRRLIVKAAPGMVWKHRDQAVRQLDKTTRVVTFVASTEEIDRDGDLVRIRGIDTRSFAKNPVFLQDHDPRLPLGRVTDLWIERFGDHDALLGKAELLPPGSSSRIDEAWAEIRGGLRAAVSIGFLPLEVGEETAAGGRTFERVELLEISSVTLPSCRGCLVTEASTAKGLGTGAPRFPDPAESLVKMAELAESALDGIVLEEKFEAAMDALDSFGRTGTGAEMDALVYELLDVLRG